MRAEIGESGLAEEANTANLYRAEADHLRLRDLSHLRIKYIQFLQLPQPQSLGPLIFNLRTLRQGRAHRVIMW